MKLKVLLSLSTCLWMKKSCVCVRGRVCVCVCLSFCLSVAMTLCLYVCVSMSVCASVCLCFASAKKPCLCVSVSVCVFKRECVCFQERECLCFAYMRVNAFWCSVCVYVCKREGVSDLRACSSSSLDVEFEHHHFFCTPLQLTATRFTTLQYTATPHRRSPRCLI